jgi:hypothetical protein
MQIAKYLRFDLRAPLFQRDISRASLQPFVMLALEHVPQGRSRASLHAASMAASSANSSGAGLPVIACVSAAECQPDRYYAVNRQVSEPPPAVLPACRPLSRFQFLPVSHFTRPCPAQLLYVSHVPSSPIPRPVKPNRSPRDPSRARRPVKGAARYIPPVSAGVSCWPFPLRWRARLCKYPPAEPGRAGGFTV